MYCARVLWINADDEQRESACVCASVMHTWDNILSRTSRDIDVTSAISVNSTFIANVGYYRLFLKIVLFVASLEIIALENVSKADYL